MRGRHARAIMGVPGIAAMLLAVIASRWGRVALGGAVGLGVALTLALVTTGSGPVPKAATVDVAVGTPRPLPRAVAPSRPSHGGDQAALAYLRARDPVHARHVRDVQWTGPMLRVYTDLPASEADSKAAIGLCEAAAAYLNGTYRVPVVFVHADRNAGYPVLANKLDAADGCGLNRVP